MVVEGLISEIEAVQQAGVSARTLQRFSEAGYLTVQVKRDGDRWYLLSQLREIFGSFQEEPSPSSVTEESTEVEEAIGPSCSRDAATYYTPAEPAPLVERATVADVAPSETSATNNKALEKLQEEISRLKNLVALQERILDMKESEIQDLRSQRDWLKTRVEKLEEKGDRDQVLLLSETQALRQLIGLQQKRTSTLRNLLEWLGLGQSGTVAALPSNQDIASNTGAQGTIVVNKAANS